MFGEFNRGKSTLLNALVGQRVLPAGVIPTTRVATLLSPGGPQGWWWRLPSAPGDPSVRRAPCPAGADAARRPSSPEEAPPGSLLELGLGATGWGERLALLDTPGLADPRLGERDGGLVDWLSRCDLILLLLDAGQPLTAAELRFASEWMAPRGPGRVWIVLNRADLLDPEELVAARAHLVETLPSALRDAPLFVCAPRLDLRSGDSGTGALRSALAALDHDRSAALRGRALEHEGSVLARSLARELDLVDAALRLSPAALERLSAHAAERSAAAPAGLAELRRRVQQAGLRERELLSEGLAVLVERLEREVPPQIEGADPQDLKRYLADFLRDTFAAWAELHAQSVSARLGELAAELTALHGDWLRRATQAALDPVGLPRPATVWQVDTPVGDGGVVALGAAGTALAVVSGLGVGALVALAAPALASLVQLGRGHRVRQLAQQHTLAALQELSVAVAAGLSARTERALLAMEAYLADAGAPVHAAVDEVLRRVGALGSLSAERRAAELRAAADARAALTLAWPDSWPR